MSKANFVVVSQAGVVVMSQANVNVAIFTACLLRTLTSTVLFIRAATLAISLIASSSKTSSTPSVARSSTCCLIMLVTGSVRILYISSSVKPLRLTLMGSLPWSSAKRSLGLQEWKAPLEINKMKSVLTFPCFVLRRERTESRR